MARIGKKNRKNPFSSFGLFLLRAAQPGPFFPPSRAPSPGPAGRLAAQLDGWRGPVAPPVFPPPPAPPSAAHRPADSRPSRLAACPHPSRACALSNRSAAAAFPVGSACKPRSRPLFISSLPRPRVFLSLSRKSLTPIPCCSPGTTAAADPCLR
jgi:hypothetical protein